MVYLRSTQDTKHETFIYVGVDICVISADILRDNLP